MLRLLPLTAQCSFHASVSSLNILLGYIENLKALKLDPKTLTYINQKTVWGISDFHNLSITMASDVTHNICKILMSKTWQKNQKGNSNIINSLHRFENIPLLFEIVWNLIRAVGFYIWFICLRRRPLTV